MTKSKRPWKKHARVDRRETNGGDVTFITVITAIVPPNYGSGDRATFQSLSEAEADLDTWFADWWPKQEKSRRPA